VVADHALHHVVDEGRDDFEELARARPTVRNQRIGRGVELPARLRTAAGSVVGFDTVCEKHAVIGDSNLAVEKLKELAQKTGATNLLTWFNIGTVPHAAVKAGMEQFALEVMPKL